MATVHDALTVDWAGNGSGCAIDKPPALVKRSTLDVDDLGKFF